MSVRILNLGNAGPGEPAPEPTELSRQILTEARTIKAPEQCARLDALTARLRRLDPAQISGDAARIAFWVNLYNALLLHCLCLKPVRGSMLRHLRLFGRVAYEVGWLPYTLNLIEHGVLRGNRRPAFRLRRPLRESDPRLAAAPSRLDPRIHFALNCGARSCPPVRVYDPGELDDQLEQSMRTYLEAETEVDIGRCRVTLPRLMRLYSADFGDRDDQLALAARHVSAVRDCRERTERTRVRYGRFDWTAAASE